MSYFVGENLEKRYVELRLDGVEVGVNAVEGGDKGFPCVPHAVFVGGSFRSDSKSGLSLRSAESTEEIIAGRGGARRQDCSCG